VAFLLEVEVEDEDLRPFCFTPIIHYQIDFKLEEEEEEEESLTTTVTMVRQGDFEISLVHADTKLPFKEHIKDGNVYVEVEPDEEYFICMQRVGNAHQGILLAVASVDESIVAIKLLFHLFVAHSMAVC
jgi:hypothetical protein